MMPYKAVVGKRQFYRRLKKRREIICKDLNSEKLLTKVNYENANVKNDTDNLNTDVSVGCETSHNSLGTPNILNSNDCLLNETLQLNTLVPCKHDTTVFEFVPENSQYSNKLGICQELRNWVIRSGSLPHNSVTYLLHVLSKYHPELPLDCRTLLKTPTKTLMRPLNKGNYCHLGISTALENFLLRNPKFTESVIEIAFNIDGLPLYKSCNSQLWPILGQIKNFNSKPFSIGIFYGSSKPQPLNLFLDDFISELKHLIDNTFCFKGKLYEIKVFAFICDAPARSFLKCIKSHNGYSSCEKCIEVGDYIDGRIVLKSVTSQKRTDDSFLRQTDDDHHTGISPLVKLSIGLVSKFPIDYMHTVCLGVVRKLLHTWTSGPLKVRLCSSKVQKISETLEHFCKSIPIEFNRKSRSLSELARWKATEFRTFLLYLGPVVLKGTIPVAIYEHFLLLHCAISILISKQRLSDIGVNYADTLLKTFVTHCSKIYGQIYLVYNIHYLCHLSDDVLHYGPLDQFSAFPFENALNQIKRLVKSTTNPLAQICNRLIEANSVILEPNEIKKTQLKMKHCSGPLLSKHLFSVQYKQVIFSEITLSIISHSNADCYIMYNSDIMQIQNIVCDNQKLVKIITRVFKSKSAWYNYPFSSERLNIYLVSDLSENLTIWPLNENVIVKCIVLQLDDNQWVSFPIVHSLNEHNK
ncbi:uncharacterized protein [Diabrotica undecimpunctata]|uniref:uncharacterized protein n=1 Tax=Diabrotica undecimpunctata TaxID=50387 RepID=UPI003B6359A3